MKVLPLALLLTSLVFIAGSLGPKQLSTFLRAAYAGEELNGRDSCLQLPLPLAQVNRTTPGAFPLGRLEIQLLASNEHSTAKQPDSALDPEAIKSWTTEVPAASSHRGFLDSLKWEDHPLANDYNMRTGLIYDKWIAAVQFVRKNHVVLTEYTPPGEYVTVIDPLTGNPVSRIAAVDTNQDGIPKIAFLHQKLNDANYHMYAVYALNQEKPKLLWKSAGKLGDWLHKVDN